MQDFFLQRGWINPPVDSAFIYTDIMADQDSSQLSGNLGHLLTMAPHKAKQRPCAICHDIWGYTEAVNMEWPQPLAVSYGERRESKMYVIREYTWYMRTYRGYSYVHPCPYDDPKYPCGHSIFIHFLGFYRPRVKDLDVLAMDSIWDDYIGLVYREVMAGFYMDSFYKGNVLKNRWVVGDRLDGSQGSFNKGIFLVHDINEGDTCVLKLLSTKSFSPEVTREIYLLRKMDHPNVVYMVDYFIPDSDYDYPWIALEHCQQGTLEGFLDRAHEVWKYTRKCIPETLLWQLFYDLAKAISYCHYGPPDANGEYDPEWDSICHRDIILSNIFIAQYMDPQGEYRFPVFKLGDFGCAVARSELAERGLCLNYLPPVCPWDQPPEGNVASVAGDVYQVGKIMFYLISHISSHHIGPEELDDNYQVVAPVTSDAPRVCLDTYSMELRKLVDSCLCQYPEARPGSKELVKLVDRDYPESPKGCDSLAPYFDHSE